MLIYSSGRGSSPLSRGIPGKSLLMVLDAGIIPALAGNTKSFTNVTNAIKDHPRSRGEYELAPLNHFMFHGSSPLSRGILPRGVARPLGRGIIPALAGNTSEPQLPSRLLWDHPRSRGEYCIGVQR